MQTPPNVVREVRQQEGQTLIWSLEMESGNGWGNGGRFLNVKHVHKSSAEDRMSVRPAEDELPQCPGPVTQ